MIATPRVKALAGLILLLALIGLGILARTAAVTHDDLRVDELVRPLRFGTATTVFRLLTTAASEAVGLTALAVAVVVLFLCRRRWDAIRLLAMVGSAWVLALVVKDVIDRPRPPQALWVIAPDPTGSFPSGHDTTASIVVVIALMLTARSRTGVRVASVAAAVVFALLVGASRVYLGDHYPTDVLGSYLAVGAAALLVWAVSDTMAVRRVAARALRSPDLAEAPLEG